MTSKDFLQALCKEFGTDIVHPAKSGDGEVVLRPRSAEDISGIVRLCAAHKRSLVPLGGRTSMVQGAILREGEVGLSLERLNEIGVIDTDAHMVTVGAGAVLQTVQDAARDSGLLFPVDIGARGSATIGGMISTNAGGNHVVRYGMTRQSVVALEVVLGDGTILRPQPSVLKNNAGYDLKHLFIGSEGTLGIVTKAILRLHPAPRHRHCAWVATDDYGALLRFLRLMQEHLGGTLTAFEVMWQDYYEFMTGSLTPHMPPVSHGHAYYALVESQDSGPGESGEAFEAGLGKALEEGLIVDAVVSRSDKDRERMWAVRDDVGQVFKLGTPWSFDLSLPTPDIAAFVETVRQALEPRWPNPNLMVFGHLGDGNIHLSVTLPESQEDSRDEIEKVVYSRVKSFHGSIAAEHGIGLEKKESLGFTRTPEDLDVMRRLKRALDPDCILNPGRVFDLSKT